MPKETSNYNLKKPLYSENADIGVLNDNLDMLDEILTPTVADREPDGNKGKLSLVLGWFANRIKAITGKGSWRDAPAVTLEECGNHISSGIHANATVNSSGFMSSIDKQKLDGATSDKVSSKLIMRDSMGRAKVHTPSAKEDIVNKEYVDNNFVRKNANTTMTAQLTAYSNTAYTTKQVRNIVFWTSGETPPATSYGDVVIKTF